MILGTISGVIFNNIGFDNSSIYSVILLLGDIFIRLLKMVIVPLINCRIVRPLEILAINIPKNKTRLDHIQFTI